MIWELIGGAGHRHCATQHVAVWAYLGLGHPFLYVHLSQCVNISLIYVDNKYVIVMIVVRDHAYALLFDN